MFKKLASWLSDKEAAPKARPNTKTADRKSPPPAQNSVETEDPEMLIRQAILEAERTMAMEEKIAGHDPKHLEAVRGAMMIYRQKQESLESLPLEEKARLRALGEAMFGGELSKSDKKAKKTH